MSEVSGNGMLTYEVQSDILDEVRRSKKEVCSLRGSIRNVLIRGPSTSLISSVVAFLCRLGMRVGETFTQLSS